MAELNQYVRLGQRIFIRSARIIAGLTAALIALWPLGYAWDGLSMPFAQQSVLGLIGSLIAGLIGIAGITVAWGIAFGEGPSR